MNGDLFFDGKKFISSSRAAKISGYVPDYIGQLCRDGKIEARKVGKTWFVSLESVFAHKNLNPEGKFWRRQIGKKNESKTENVFGFVQKEARPVKSEPEIISVLHDTEIPLEQKVSDVLEVGTKIVYESDSAPLIPVLKTEIREFSEEIVPSDTKSKVGESLSSFGEQKELRKFAIEAGERKLSAPSFLFFAKAAFGLAIFISFSIFGSTFISDSSFLVVLKNIGNNGQINKAVAYESLNSFDRFSLKFYRSMHDFIRGSRLRILVWMSGNEVALESEGQTTEGKPATGLVVVPKNEDESADETVSRIKKSFSDDVAVVPGPDGESGVIKPEFKSEKGEDYLYVLVPIKE